MPFDAELPPQGTDPWYAPLKAAWDALTSFVNGLESSLSNKVNVSTYTSGMSGKVSTGGAAKTLWLGTQAEYDAIATKSPDTVYVIRD